jgi:deoxyribose-phosphate aldolase
MTREELASCIDHTLLKPEATAAQIDQLCKECLRFGFASACVNPAWVERCRRRLAGARSVVCTVAGFPLGATTPQAKAFEAAQAVEHGAHEIDMVVNLAAMLAGDADAVTHDIATVCQAVKRADDTALLKVILESRVLSEPQILLGCRCAIAARADFVKTSTGMHAAGGATVEHVALLRRYAGPLKVKAAGGIRDLPTALAMLNAGADRIGSSSSVAIIEALPD